ACLLVFSTFVWAPLLPPLLGGYPEVRLNIGPQESPVLEEWLAAQRHDVGLTETLHAPAGTTRTELLTLNEVCVLPCDQPLAAKTVLTPDDFQGENFISLPRLDSYLQLLDTVFAEPPVNPRIVVETPSPASVSPMVSAG
ncbi:LysR substrate-binding domain-containing protein, partial [Salmonella enterica]|uniref:LysR substrate-binding domain-containing protein n=1 Tax=Salmonella enterica TaxID=28901 RepID=UPI002ADEC3CE